MRNIPAPHSPTRQRGASLIEVLVTLLIITFGLMGMSALQARALKGSVSSFQRGQAVIYAQYLLDVMRIDREQAKGGDYNTGKVCDPAAFGAGSLANNSRTQWLTSLRSDIGQTPTTCAAVACDADYLCTVKIYWDDSNAGGLDDQVVEVSSRV